MDRKTYGEIEQIIIRMHGRMDGTVHNAMEQIGTIVDEMCEDLCSDCDKPLDDNHDRESMSETMQDLD